MKYDMEQEMEEHNALNTQGEIQILVCHFQFIPKILDFIR
jgi:hypothetical protein